MVTRANERWKQLLNEYEQPHLDEAKDEELQEYVKKVKAANEDMWY